MLPLPFLKEKKKTMEWSLSILLSICSIVSVLHIIDAVTQQPLGWFILNKYDDVSKWKHCPRYWPFVQGIHRGPVNSPHKWSVMRSFHVFFDLCLNKRLSKQLWGWWFETPSYPLWRHCNGWNCLGLQIVTLWFVAHQTAQQAAHWPKENSPITWAGGLLSKFHVKFKGLRPVLEGFVVPMHEGACETGSQIPRA